MAEEPYDPQKAHEAYLRRRQLKGRQSGSVEDSSSPSKSKVVVKAPAKKTPAQRHAEAEVRVKALKQRLEKLRKVLAELVKQAKARSGVETKSETPAEKAESSKGSDKQSAQEKREAAKRSKDYYEKNKKDESPSEQTKDLELDIKKVREKIQKIRDELKGSIQQARDQTTQ